MFKKCLYFFLVVLQFFEVCLTMILWASILAFFPMLAKVSIHVFSSKGWVGIGGIVGV